MRLWTGVFYTDNKFKQVPLIQVTGGGQRSLLKMTWPPQSPDLNPIAMVWDELDHQVKEKQPTSAQHVGTHSRLLEKQRMPRVCKAVKAKGGYFEVSKIRCFWLLGVIS